MAKIAQSTCTVCHVIKPRTEMQQKTKSEYSGNSIGINKKGATSGRVYNRQKSIGFVTHVLKMKALVFGPGSSLAL